MNEREIADKLTREQRKTIRRLGRGQRVGHMHIKDPVISRLTTTKHHLEALEGKQENQ